MARVLIISSQSCEGEVHFGGLLRAPLRRCWTLRPSRPPPAPVRPAQTTARHRCAPPRARRATATAPSSPSLPLRRPLRRRRGQSGEHTELMSHSWFFASSSFLHAELLFIRSPSALGGDAGCPAHAVQLLTKPGQTLLYPLAAPSGAGLNPGMGAPDERLEPQRRTHLCLGGCAGAINLEAIGASRLGRRLTVEQPSGLI